MESTREESTVRLWPVSPDEPGEDEGARVPIVLFDAHAHCPPSIVRIPENVRIPEAARAAYIERVRSARSAEAIGKALAEIPPEFREDVVRAILESGWGWDSVGADPSRVE